PINSYFNFRYSKIFIGFVCASIAENPVPKLHTRSSSGGERKWIEGRLAVYKQPLRLRKKNKKNEKRG
ncbi:MAG: hypothetical protein LBM67_00735, partial [Lentimicrobiaceae bacterium]|nr:hypothetical protein [Lentimicrobiaceae bacterium]